ncbi:MAG: hypothetical protein R3B92_03185 [Patescibacteria group bacterium]
MSESIYQNTEYIQQYKILKALQAKSKGKELQTINLELLKLHVNEEFLDIYRKQLGKYTKTTDKEIIRLEQILDKCQQLVHTNNNDVRKEILNFKIILLKHAANLFKTNESLIVDTFSEPHIKAINNNYVTKGILDNKPCTYTKLEKKQIIEKIKSVHDKIYHFTNHKKNGQLLSQRERYITALKTHNEEVLIKSLMLKLFGGAYSEITNSDIFVYFGFNYKRGQEVVFQDRKELIIVDTKEIGNENIYVTCCHRQFSSLLASLNCDLLLDFQKHIQLTIEFFNKGIYDLEDFIHLQAKMFMTYDPDKVLLKNHTLENFLLKIRHNKESFLDKEGWPIAFVRFDYDSVPNEWEINLLNDINKLCQENRICPPILGDVIIENNVTVK